jgi:anti-sigma B factor antagonist
MAGPPPAHRAPRGGRSAAAPLPGRRRALLTCSKLLPTGVRFQTGLAFAAPARHSEIGGARRGGRRDMQVTAPQSAREEGVLNIKKKADGDVMVLQLSGKIMGGPDHEKFHSEIKTLIKEGYVDILLNMAKVSWINSTGLGVLVSAFHTLKKNGGRLKICEVSDRIDNILNVTQLKLVFQTFESCDEALKSFASE